MPVRPAIPPATLPAACPASCPAACAQPLLHLDALSWSAPFPGAPILFDRLTLQAGAGVLGVTGDEGRGKSALLRLIAGELRPDAGRILIGASADPADPVALRERLFWCDPQSDRHDGLVARDYLAMQRQGRPGWSEVALTAQLEGFALHEHLDKRLRCSPPAPGASCGWPPRWPRARRWCCSTIPARRWTRARSAISPRRCASTTTRRPGG